MPKQERINIVYTVIASIDRDTKFTYGPYGTVPSVYKDKNLLPSMIRDIGTRKAYLEITAWTPDVGILDNLPVAARGTYESNNIEWVDSINANYITAIENLLLTRCAEFLNEPLEINMVLRAYGSIVVEGKSRVPVTTPKLVYINVVPRGTRSVSGSIQRAIEEIKADIPLWTTVCDRLHSTPYDPHLKLSLRVDFRVDLLGTVNMESSPSTNSALALSVDFVLNSDLSKIDVIRGIGEPTEDDRGPYTLLDAMSVRERHVRNFLLHRKVYWALKRNKANL